MATYAETLSSLFERTARGIKLGLDSTRALLGALGNPERQLGRVMLVAGTNGKGSTASLVATALGAAGHRVGLFTSPHLLEFSERIRIGRARIGAQAVCDIYDAICRVEDCCPQRPTFFECTTAIAIKHFADAGVDAAVLEVGLGGRLDATNVVPPDLAVITPIALDHQKILGTDLSSIAAEKAAIIPEGGRVVTAPQPAAAYETILSRVEAAGARLVHAPRATIVADGLHLAGGDFGPELVLSTWPRVAYQLENVTTAAAACRVLDDLGLACPPEAFARAAGTFHWPGRYQWLKWTDFGVDVLVDGGHNVAAMAALRDAMEADSRAAGRPMHWVFSALRDKPAAQMLAQLSGRYLSLHLCPLPSHRTRTAAALATLAPAAIVHHNVAAALDDARERAASDGGFVLASGSLFLAGDVIGRLTHAPRDPAVRF